MEKAVREQLTKLSKGVVLMHVKVTVYLKSGGDTSMVVYNTSFEEQSKNYQRYLEKGFENNTIIHQTPQAVVFIPANNIATISFTEWKE